MATFKEQFHLCPNHVYLNAAFQGAMPRTAEEAGRNSIAKWASPWEKQAKEFFQYSEELRGLAAQMLRCAPRNIALVPAVSYGIETAIKNLPLEKRKTVLLPEDEFPSNVYPWREACKNTGSKITFVSRPKDFNWTDRFCEAINRDVSVVSIPLSDWSDGTFFDLRAISKRCKEVGAALVVDVSQAMGAVPIDISQFEPDFLVSVGYKWQLGPHGLAYLYVADHHLNGAPLENNWLNRVGSENFAGLTQYVDEYKDGARRFDSGAHNQLITTPIAIEGLKFLLDAKIENVFAHITGLHSKLLAGIVDLPLSTADRNRMCGHVTGLYCQNPKDIVPLTAHLRERKICISLRGQALRISPHVYNDESDMDRLVHAVRDYFSK